MKNTKLKPSLMHFYQLASFLILVVCTISVSAQTKISPVKIQLDSITGVVYDALTKKPLVGAQLQTLNPQYSAMTDESGTFKIKFPAYLNTLIVTAPDYGKKEVPLFKGDLRKEITLSPNSDNNYFNDELTSVGKRRKATVSNAQNSIEINNFSSISLDAELQRKMAGQIQLTTHSGTIAAGSTMLIRGLNSLSANTQPLYVIDGVIQDNQVDKVSIHLGNQISPLSNIDVNDIETVSVLRDGTSLYGSKGGNGVILISTNRGRSMATKITVSSMFGYTTKPNTTPMMTGDQYRLYVSDLLGSGDAQKQVSNQLFLNNDPKFIYYNRFHNSTNWTDGVYGNGNTQGYNVSVNGGGEVALYNLSVGFANGQSTLKENDFSRLNARFNSDIVLAKEFSTIFDISYAQTARKLRNDGIAESYDSQINSPGFLSLIKAPFLSPYQFSNAGKLTSKLEDYDFMMVANPYAILEYGLGKTQQTNFNLSVVPTYTFNKSLKLSSNFSYLLNNLSENLFSPMYGVAPYYNSQDMFTTLNHVKTQFAKQTSIFSDTRLNWIKNYRIHAVELNAGVRYLCNSYKSEYATGHNTGNDLVKEMSKDLDYKSVGGINEPSKVLTYYGVFDYSLKNKYFLEGAITAETNSRFGKEATSGIHLLGVSWGIFPSINASWLISSENFMKSIHFINLLKLRTGYGLSGNDGIQNTAARAYFNAIQYKSNKIGLGIMNIANPAIQWETVTKRNVGLDANLFNNRLSFTVDLYKHITDNLLVQKDLTDITGLGTYWSNDGKLENKGYEISLNAKIIETKDFHLTVGASVGHNANKILALANGDYKTSVYGGEIMTAVGQPIGQFYGYQTNGVYSTTEEALADGLSQRTNTGALVPFQAGDVRFVNNNSSDKVIDEKDKVVLGNSNPDFFGAFNAGVKYKNLGIQFVFNYSYGNKIYNYLRSQIESGSTFYNQSMTVNNRWISEGQKTSVPKSTWGDPRGNNRFSDRWIEDGSFLKLKTIELSYDFPIKASFIQGLTVWASANNLFTWTKYLGIDPEFSTNNQTLYQGIDTGLLPQSKSFFAGFKIYL